MASPRIDYSKKHVLLVESSGNMRSAVFYMLRSLGVENIKAMTVSERVLLELAEQEYDVVLLGHNVSDALTGIQLLEEARYRGYMKPGMGWIFMTSDASQATVLQAIDSHPDYLLTKPFSIDELKFRVDQLLLRQQAFSEVNDALRHGDLEGAYEACMGRFSPFDENYAEAQRQGCQLLLQMQRWPAAEALAKECYWRTFDKECGLYWAQALYQQNKLSEASELLHKLVEGFPLFIAAYDLLAEVQEVRGELVTARDTLQLATARSPNGIPRQMELGRLATHTDDFAMAASAYRKSINLGKTSCYRSAEPYLRLANIRRLEMNATADAKRKDLQQELNLLLDKALLQFKSDKALEVRVGLLRSEVCQQLGDDDEAARQLRLAQLANEALEQPLDLESERGLMLAGGAPKRAPESPSAATANATTGTAKRDTEMSSKVNRLGVKSYTAGKVSQALKYFALALEYDLHNSHAVLNLAQVFLESARDNREKRPERLRMVDRYIRLAHKHDLDRESRAKLERVRTLRAMDVAALPEGSLGGLLV